MSVNHQTGAAAYLWLDDAGLIAQCDVDCYRSSGPGGQKRNKTSSAVRLRHEPTGLAASAVEDRSQHVNKVRALRRLRRAIALHVRTPIDLDRYMPSELLNECIGGEGRFRVNRRDARYYLVISEVLDVLAASEMSVRELAQHLGMSTGQMIKLLSADSRLWARVNEMREEVGIQRLRSSTK